MPEEPQMEVCDIVQEAVIKTIPKKKKCNKAKWLSEEALQIAEKRREAKSKGEKKTYIYLNSEFQRIAVINKKAFLTDHSKHPLPISQKKTLHIKLTRWSILK